MIELIPSDIPRFRSHVMAAGPDECWPFVGTMDRDGYGHFSMRGKAPCAHRVAFTIAFGPIPEGKVVCHRCDNPPCCNPAHLWAGTIAENNSDKRAKGREPMGDDHWSRHRPENLARGLRNGKYTKPEKTPRGESHGSVKISAADVLEIQRLYAAGGISQQKLADRFGVRQAHVSRIVLGRVWKCLETEKARPEPNDSGLANEILDQCGP